MYPNAQPNEPKRPTAREMMDAERAARAVRQTLGAMAFTGAKVLGTPTRQQAKTDAQLRAEREDVAMRAARSLRNRATVAKAPHPTKEAFEGYRARGGTLPYSKFKRAV